MINKSDISRFSFEVLGPIKMQHILVLLQNQFLDIMHYFIFVVEILITFLISLMLASFFLSQIRNENET